MKKLSRKQILLINVVTIVLAVLIVLFVRLIRLPKKNSEKSLKYTHEITIKEEDKKLLVISDEKETKWDIPYDYLFEENKKTNYLGDELMFLSSYGDLYYVNVDEGLMKIATDVKDFMLCPYGRACSYITFSDELYYMNLSELSSRLVSKSVPRFFTLSPDGNALLFTMEEEGNTQCAIFFSDGRMQVISKNYVPVAVSNEGDVSYVYDPDTDHLIAFKDAKERVLCENYSDGFYKKMLEEGSLDIDKVLLNMDGSEIIFSTGIGAFLSQNGGKAEKISDTEVVIDSSDDINVISVKTSVGFGEFYPYHSLKNR